MLEIKNKADEWKTCFYTIADIPSNRLQTGLTAINLQQGKSPFVSRLIVKYEMGVADAHYLREPELPLTDGEVSADKLDPNDEKVSRQMWAKIMNKLNTFEKDLELSTDYIKRLVDESDRKVTKFEKTFEPLTTTIAFVFLFLAILTYSDGS